jgi:exodeoxyribonuclease V beta subunit
VRAKLEDLVSGGGEPAGDEQVRRGDFWTIDDSARDKLARALRVFDEATIATIHAFCQRVLRENAFSSGRLFEEQQVDGRAAFGRAVREAFRRDVARDASRARWLEASLRSGRSIASIEEFLWRCTMARAALRPEFDPAVLDTALGAFPVEDARGLGLAEEVRGWGAHRQTANKVARVLLELAELVERARFVQGPPLFVLEAKGLDLAWLLGKLTPLTPRPGPAARLRAAALDLARATPPFSAALAHALLPSVREELTRSKRAAGRYDFDDMLVLVDEALQGSRGTTVAGAMRRRWRYALIDEFQDTDETQWSIFRRAFFEQHTGHAPSTIFLVGDPKQSIYRFRGADVETYVRARHEVLAAGGQRVRLERNYRATPALVEATNAFFDAQVAVPFFTGHIAYAPIECGQSNRVLVDGDGRPVSPVHVFRFHGELPLATLGALIAREIGAITNAARPWQIDGRPIEHNHVFVLTRNAREGRTIGAALGAAGVPHAFFKEEGLFQTGEAKDLRVLLTAICDPDDRACRLAAWLTPFFGLPLVAIERARDLPASHPLVERLHEWKTLADARDFDRLFESIVTDSGVVRREIFFARTERELTNYIHVLELLLERARGAHITLRELVQELSGLIGKTRVPIDIEGNVQRLESERRAVQIMTIHKSKGLEAPIVFVAGGLSAPPRGEEARIYHDGGQRLAWLGPLSPEVKLAIEREEREEDQRLLYVALTRAVGRLYLPCVVDDAPAAKRSHSTDRPKSKVSRGPYSAVNRRVLDLVAAREPLLALEDVPDDVDLAANDSALDGAWQPPMSLLRDDDRSAAYATLRSRHAGAIVTSYTRMRGERGGGRASWLERLDERRTQKAVEEVDEAPRTTLRAARASGVFLHEMLERVPLTTFAGAAGLDQWRSLADVSALFDEAIAAHRIDRKQRHDAERLVWTAYTTVVNLPGGDRLDGLAAAACVVREMEFVYPIPEPEHPTLADAPRQLPLRVGQGYVRGSLDLAFEHRGLTYFVDWKSDSLASYAPEAVGRHVARHYDEQVRLYALAFVRLLGVQTPTTYAARFGGLLYCFLRGFDARANGLWSARPDWDEILGWDQILRARRHWGAARP